MFDKQIKGADGSVLAVLSHGSVLTAEAPVYAGGRLDALRLTPFLAGDRLEPGKRYLVRPGHVVRALEGPRGPYLPASDGQVLVGDGSHAVVARVVALHVSETDDDDSGAEIVKLPTSIASSS